LHAAAQASRYLLIALLCGQARLYINSACSQERGSRTNPFDVLRCLVGQTPAPAHDGDRPAENGPEQRQARYHALTVCITRDGYEGRPRAAR
jgi:hypothetical protein